MRIEEGEQRGELSVQRSKRNFSLVLVKWFEEGGKEILV